MATLTDTVTSGGPLGGLLFVSRIQVYLGEWEGGGDYITNARPIKADCIAETDTETETETPSRVVVRWGSSVCQRDIGVPGGVGGITSPMLDQSRQTALQRQTQRQRQRHLHVWWVRWGSSVCQRDTGCTWGRGRGDYTTDARPVKADCIAQASTHA